MKNSIHFSTAEVRGQQIYYCNVSNLATCQLFLSFIIFLNTKADNFIFTNSKILQGLRFLSQQKAAASRLRNAYCTRPHHLHFIQRRKDPSSLLGKIPLPSPWAEEK